MKVLVYSAKAFEIPFLKRANNAQHELTFTEEHLTSATAMMAIGHQAVTVFSADDASHNILEKLNDFGVKYITLRSAGHDNINLPMARKLGIKVANAPDYSPHAIAEHALTLLQAFNRNIVQSQLQLQNNNFSLHDLVGFDLYQKKVGILGVGRIGSIIAKILHGFGCEIYANDTIINETVQKNYNATYISKDAICKEADIIFISLPLTSETHHLIDEDFLQKIKKETIIINIARGAIVNTTAVLNALDNGQLAGYATDVYEKERGVFFYDHSEENITLDPQLEALINHPKVLLTPHQAFVTKEALKNIANSTIENINCWENGKVTVNELP